VSRALSFLNNQHINSMNQTIIVSDNDERRLRQLLEVHRPAGPDEIANLKRLTGELDRARIVPHDEMPPDVVMLGSTVELVDLDDGQKQTFTLALPQQADVTEGRISILAPLATGMLGFRAGDEIEWPVPAGTARVRIRRIVEQATSNLMVTR
jgi:regulator of nucleoside diphosphate kinase